MKLIITPSDLKQQFAALLDKYNNYYFAAAWAGVPSGIFDTLLKNSTRIKQLAIGIHFYQSDPAFFKEFINDKRIRVVLQSDGTYHPKLFLFYDSDREWTLLIGSGNFTEAAFSRNTEAAMMIESSEATSDILVNAKKIINASWNRGKNVDSAFYEAYKLQWNIMRTRRRELAGTIDYQNILKDGVTEFMRLSWDKYVAKFNGLTAVVNRRFEMLETIRRIFASGHSLMQMSENERRLIAGNPNDLDLPGAKRHADFGTSGNGNFMKKMIQGNTYISDALDKIPLVGNITEDNFIEFMKVFLLDPDTTAGWVSSAGRLLAMKRPDTFYNITNANRERFCVAFENTQSQTKNLNNYWGLIISKIHLSTWYNEVALRNNFERKLYETRAAMLDVLFYIE